MNSKTIGIIVIILVALAAIIGGYTLLSSGPHYKNITMNGLSMEVPDNNFTVDNQTKFYSTYNDTNEKINIFVFDSEGAGLSDMSEAATFAGYREASQVGAKLVNKEGMNYNYSESLKTYSSVTNYNHKNLLITTQKEEDMLHILKTVQVKEE